MSKKKAAREEPPSTDRSQRTREDAAYGQEIGIAASDKIGRALAVTGKQGHARTAFSQHHKGVLHAGVLFGLPALISQGLDNAFTVYRPLPNGFYGLAHLILLSCFMALCRIKNPEQLKRYPPGELGKLLGLDRIPELGHLRKKLKQILVQNRTDQLHRSLFREWLTNIGELNEKLKQATQRAIIEPKQEIPGPKDPDRPRFTVVFDRESYEPKWFKSLWDMDRVAMITYRKNDKGKWGEHQFKEVEYTRYNNKVTGQLCEMGVCLNDVWFREIRRLSPTGHQTSIVTTNKELKIAEVAQKMFARWTQENYFKYMIENFDFDKMIEHGVDPVDQKCTVPNPRYNQITYQLKKLGQKRARIQARVYTMMEKKPNKTIERVMEKINDTSDLIESINLYRTDIEKLILERKQIPSRIKVSDMPPDKRYNKLKQEGKKFKNAIVMLAYRAETALYNTMAEFYNNTKKDGRAILTQLEN